ncbi:hypothetical protein D3C80_1438640 [compost metagenome]
MAASILDVATLTGVGIEQRAQAVTCVLLRGRNLPGIAEKAVTDKKIHSPKGRQVGRGHGKPITVCFVNTGRTARELFTRLRGGELL